MVPVAVNTFVILGAITVPDAGRMVPVPWLTEMVAFAPESFTVKVLFV